jgi:Asp-tRNA(Asn)/Glu-tRNA(Gln) amidotransferase A subunit family amidase
VRLTEALLRRIEAADPIINAVAELRAEEALDEATSADKAVASETSLAPCTACR